VSQLSHTQSRSLGYFPHLDLAIIGVFSVLILQLYRLPTHVWLPALVLETVLLLSVPVVALGVLLKPHRVEFVFRSAAWIPLGAVSFAILGLLVQYGQRLVGLGDSTEVVCLVVLQFVGWYLIVFSSLVPSYRKVGFVTSCALVLFVCFTNDRASILVVSFFFAIVALWHLLSNYWSKLDSKALDGQSRMLPISSIAIASTLLFIVCTSAIAWAVVPQDLVTRLAGFSPFSGGESGKPDHFARAGVGDGHMLSAGQNATTTGPVESDQFVEDDKPSMYDVNVERNEPATEFKKIKRSRSVAIDAKAKHLHKIIQSEQAGRSFRTSRKPPSNKVIDLENRISKALFLVEGSTPVRFSISSFQHFDGWDWSKTDLDKKDLKGTEIRLVQRRGTPWFENSIPDNVNVTSSRAHQVKVLRLKTDSVPVPPLHRAWHIDLVDDPTMFEFNAQGVLRMQRKTVPSHTIIDNISDIPNFYALAEGTSYQPIGANSPFSQIPNNQSKARITRLAESWTEGLPAGWQQVESIINHLRNEYIHDPQLVATENHSDSVASFLNQGGGPAYQFASAATQILRAAGYRTRLQQGFLVQTKDYNPIAGQSVVTSENLHMWPEVSLNGVHWIPVEPTPGFPIPYNHLSWWQWCKVQTSRGLVWIVQHPFVSLAIALLVGCVVRFRLDLFVAAGWGLWLVALRLSPSRQLTATRKLIDLRCWAAGLARPSFVPAPDWYSRLDPEATEQFCRFWQVENFSLSGPSLLQRKAVARVCKQIVNELSFYRIKSHSQSQAKQ